MTQLVSDDLLPIADMDVDADALNLLEEDLNEINSVRMVKTPFRLFVDDLSNRLFHNVISTSLVISIMCGCVGVILWNELFRVPDMDKLFLLESEHLNKHELKEFLTTQLSEFDQTDLAEQLGVESYRVFSGFPALVLWIDEIVKLARSLSIDVTYRIEQSHPAPIDNVLEVPVVLEFSSSSDASTGVFTDAMKVVNEMLSDQWHLDIISTLARGEASGMANMEVTAQVWVSDGGGFSNTPVQSGSISIDNNSDSYEEIVQ